MLLRLLFFWISYIAIIILFLGYVPILRRSIQYSRVVSLLLVSLGLLDPRYSCDIVTIVDYVLVVSWVTITDYHCEPFMDRCFGYKEWWLNYILG